MSNLKHFDISSSGRLPIVKYEYLPTCKGSEICKGSEKVILDFHCCNCFFLIIQNNPNAWTPDISTTEPVIWNHGLVRVSPGNRLTCSLCCRKYTKQLIFGEVRTYYVPPFAKPKYVNRFIHTNRLERNIERVNCISCSRFNE